MKLLLGATALTGAIKIMNEPAAEELVQRFWRRNRNDDNEDEEEEVEEEDSGSSGRRWPW